ncbi:unnamed protein product [Blepharisma stoltei]|uniref:Uncharacterized protein n=1 Tax=Blepharisma stoltei TaxID=1481888 RepID=A0AAU9IEX9_9CILI|nr:unnamed protein product [Blepharisma stoltei]
MSTQYYTLYFTRRLIFIITQVFLNDFPQSQLTINAVSSLCIALFLIFYRPFDNFVIQATNLITEFGIFAIFTLLTPYFFDLSPAVTNIMDNIIMHSVISVMLVQAVGPLINSIKEVYYVAKRSMSKEIYQEKKIAKNEKMDAINTWTIPSEPPCQTSCRIISSKNDISIERKYDLYQ